MKKDIQEDQNKIKIIIVGDSGVGKSNLRQRFCQNRFDPFSVKTAGVQISSRKFQAPFLQRQQRFIAHFWDIVGQLQNKDLISSFFKNIIGVIYVFDLTNKQTLQNLTLWKKKVQERNSNKSISLLLGSKSDLVHLREVTKQSAEKFKQEANIDIYFEISSLQQSGGVQQAIFTYLTGIAKQFDFGLTKPTKLKRVEAQHRSCI